MFHHPLVPLWVPLIAGLEARSSQRKDFIWRIGSAARSENPCLKLLQLRYALCSVRYAILYVAK
jgi:hypothetical protein